MAARIQDHPQNVKEEDRRAAAATECDRLRSQHELIQHAAGGKLIWAPLSPDDDGLKVLDSAGADGTWCRALYAQLPEDRLQGWYLTTDFDPLKFPSGHVAASANELRGSGFEFLTHDFTAPSWPTELHGRFDLVHQRLALAGSVATPFVTTLQRFGTLLKPGNGWVQLVELDISPQEGRDPAVEEYVALLNTVTVTTGVRPYFAAGLKDDMIQAGLVDVVEEVLKVPFGAALDREELREESVLNMVRFCTRFVELAKKFRIQVHEDLLERLERILRAEGSWMVFRVVWGRKP